VLSFRAVGTGLFPLNLTPSLTFVVLLWLSGFLGACSPVWNDPFPASEAGADFFYSAFLLRPKHLDPVQSYSEDEAIFTYAIYEPPLQYHYLKRPYTLIPGSLERLPEITHYGPDGQVLPATEVDAGTAPVARTRYTLRIREDLHYQPHPALARDVKGDFRYHALDAADIDGFSQLSDFAHQGTRPATAADFLYQIKRLAHPHLHSPAFELIAPHLPGLRDLAQRLREADRPGTWLDLRAFPLEGVAMEDAHTLHIDIQGHYPPFVYWLSMPFFAPIPWEADRFYAQPGMAERHFTLDIWPIGTGPYMLSENRPNARMVLSRNPYFRGETYPCEGEEEDRARGRLNDCGHPIPFISNAVFVRERESIPYWNKFLQGYYDASGISSDQFDQAVQMTGQGEMVLSKAMADQGLELLTQVAATALYLGFNMDDPVVGGLTQEARFLRQAISIAIDMEEFISVFLNGRGEVGMGPIPPGLFGSREGPEGLNPVTHYPEAGQVRRRALQEAHALLAKAGWPQGRHAQTGEPLVLHLDSTPTGMGEKGRADWLTRQFARLGITLVMRTTDFNRFQEKLRLGRTQLFFLGWNGDYPDAENFLFLLHGQQAKSGQESGVNAANYRNPQYDALFESMKRLPDGPKRQALMDAMVTILREDAPWVWGFHPKSYSLQHAWVKNRKPDAMIRNSLKYQRIDATARLNARAAWNRPALWPWALVLGFVGLMLWSVWRQHRAHENATLHTEST
jgi:oligopeptide transport system substrate-binding protein